MFKLLIRKLQVDVKEVYEIEEKKQQAILELAKLNQALQQQVTKK